MPQSGQPTGEGVPTSIAAINWQFSGLPLQTLARHSAAIQYFSAADLRHAGLRSAASVVLYCLQGTASVDLAALRRVRRLGPNASIIIVGSDIDRSILMWAVRAEVTDCIALPNDLGCLERRLQALVTCAPFASSRPLSTATSRRGALSAHGITRALQTVGTRFAENLTTSMLARECGMSVSTFRRQFKRAAGAPVGRYLRRVRIEAASCLLQQTQRSITDIALVTGFDDIAYFSRVFKQVVGTTPSGYRQRHGGRYEPADPASSGARVAVSNPQPAASRSGKDSNFA